MPDIFKIVANFLFEGSVKSDEVIKLQSDGIWEARIPLTHNASCKYGANTKWCTAVPSNENYFNQYSKDGLLVYFIKKSDTSQKYALSWEYNGKKQWWDNKDERTSEPDFFKNFEGQVTDLWMDRSMEYSFEDMLTNAQHPLKLLTTLKEKSLDKLRNLPGDIIVKLVLRSKNPIEIGEIFKDKISEYSDFDIFTIISNGKKKRELMRLFADRIKNFDKVGKSRLKGKLLNIQDISLFNKIIGNEDMKYDKIGTFTNGFAIVTRDGKFGFINEKNEEIVPPVYDDVNPFNNDGKAYVTKNGLDGYLTTDGKLHT